MSLFGFNKKRELSNYKLTLIITHVPTGFKVEFPAFLDMFSDAFTQQWNSEDVYGRMDPIATFINTRRAISLAWNVPAQSYYDAQNNLQKVNTLMSFMYPLYANPSSGGATAINQAPLLRIKFGNLVEDAQTGDGLLGYVNGFTFDPDLTQGMFYQEGTGPGNSSTGAQYYPKTFRLNAELNVLHEHSLGYKRSVDGRTFSYIDKGLSDSTFPYATELNSLVTSTTNAELARKEAKDAMLASMKWDVAKTDQDFGGTIEVSRKGPYTAKIPTAIVGQVIAEQSVGTQLTQPGVQLEPANEGEANPESPQNVLIGLNGDFSSMG